MRGRREGGRRKSFVNQLCNTLKSFSKRFFHNWPLLVNLSILRYKTVCNPGYN